MAEARAQYSSRGQVLHTPQVAAPGDLARGGGTPLVEGLTFPDATPSAEVPEGTYTLDVNPAGTEDTVLTVPDVALADGGVYSAFAVGTVYADSLQVLLTQDNAAGGAAASASASA